MATSNVAICNLALQKLGAKRITSLTEDSPNARTMNLCYEAIRDAELAKHRWSFAIRRAQLAADADAPDFGPAYSYTLPAEYLRLIEPDPEENYNNLDWKIEGKKVLTDQGAPLNIRFIYRVTDPNEFSPAFIEALACKLAWHTCEDITQSNQKKTDVHEEYVLSIREARRTNAIEKISEDPPEDTWVTARL